MVFICLYVIYLHEVSKSQYLLEQVKIDSKQFFKCRDDNRNISNNLNIGMAVWKSLHSWHDIISDIFILFDNSCNRILKKITHENSSKRISRLQKIT